MRTSESFDFTRDVWRARHGDDDARRLVEESVRSLHPQPTWTPFDPPPVGTMVREKPLSGGRAGVIVSYWLDDPAEWPPLHCESCRCERKEPPPCAGWWALEIKVCDMSAKPAAIVVIPAYPPDVEPEPPTLAPHCP